MLTNLLVAIVPTSVWTQVLLLMIVKLNSWTGRQVLILYAAQELTWEVHPCLGPAGVYLASVVWVHRHHHQNQTALHCDWLCLCLCCASQFSPARSTEKHRGM